MIGAQIDIVDSNNSSLNGVKGIVIDETKNTFRIQTQSKIKEIIKNQISIILISKYGTTIKTYGKSIIGRHEDKIKR